MKAIGAFLLQMLWAIPMLGQGTFVNLDFESSTVPDLPFGQSGGFVSISVALPGWQAWVGDIQASQVLHNSQPLGSAFVGVWGPAAPAGVIFQGDHSVVLGADFDPDPQTRRGAAITQVAQIPNDALSILFLAQSSSLELWFAGQELPFAPLQVFSGHTRYGADISAFAGQSGELRFSVSTSGAFLDVIEFSDTPIPEPSSAGLVILGIILVGVRRRCTQPCATHEPPPADAV